MEQVANKYACQRVLDVFEPKQGGSHIWEAIINGSDVLKGSKWIIANEQDKPLKM